jgi:glycosyltransferase involved in cell wall biosynthesis
MSIEFLNGPASLDQADDGRLISNLMHMIWLSRPDLQSVFDVASTDGRLSFIDWFDEAASREYGIDAGLAGVREVISARSVGQPLAGLVARLKSLFRGTPLELATSAEPGATLIGYAHGVLGMGEHIRMTAKAMSATRVPFGVFDFDVGVVNKQDDEDGDYPLIKHNRHVANIFHVNADQMLNTYCRLGDNFFKDRYNIGYWAWELPICPLQWVPVTRMVDEIWAPSRFIRDCFAEVTSGPVIHMPLCVELPVFDKLPRAHFGLPDGDCLFLYVFDFHSFLERKNPLAAIRAFIEAFPDRSTRAGLVLKIMNGDPESVGWQEMMELIGGDPRIHCINEVMSRAEVLALVDTCNSFVSLHRSEGFGRGPAEAMYLGKPVIATGWSGNTDFTRSDNSLLVEYELVPVRADQYVFTEGQVWAEVNSSHAARHMRYVFDNIADTTGIARRGQETIRTEFSSETIGRAMAERLSSLGKL